MLNERELRKPEWVEGFWVECADGQRWSFPRPKIRFKPRIVDGKVMVGGGATFGPEFDTNMDVLFGIVESEPVERLRVKFEIAVGLLRSNYNLSDDQVCDLVVLEPDSEDGDRRWAELTNVLAGESPKHTGSGSGAVS